MPSELHIAAASQCCLGFRKTPAPLGNDEQARPLEEDMAIVTPMVVKGGVRASAKIGISFVHPEQ